MPTHLPQDRRCLQIENLAVVGGPVDIPFTVDLHLGYFHVSTGSDGDLHAHFRGPHHRKDCFYRILIVLLQKKDLSTRIHTTVRPPLYNVGDGLCSDQELIRIKGSARSTDEPNLVYRKGSSQVEDEPARTVPGLIYKTVGLFGIPSFKIPVDHVVGIAAINHKLIAAATAWIRPPAPSQTGQDDILRCVHKNWSQFAIFV